MTTPHPFAFTREGKFSSPHRTPFISVHGLHYLNSIPLDAEEKTAVEALNAAVGALKIHDAYSATFGNDCPANALEKITDWNDDSWNGQYYANHKICHTVVDLGSWGKTYAPDHGVEDITHSPTTWGWNELLSLHPYNNALRVLSKKHQVAIEVKLIERIRRHTQSLQSGEVCVRAANSVSDFGRAEGFAVFLGNGYADFQWRSNTIEKARLFGSESLARDAIKSNRDEGVVVKVETSLKEICDTTPPPALSDALAALQKERLQNVLQTAELETLRAHVARLGNAPAVENKRKM